jgi:tRNA pseudouridine38-40 synthase
VSVFRLTIEYDGTDFSGWQAQPSIRTVQGVLEEALKTVLRQSTKLQGAGRTDAGVHALGQVASFECETDLQPERIMRGVSALAGPDVAVVEAAVAPDGFNARFDSVGKHYRYQILSRPSRSPLLGRFSAFVPQKLDVRLMRAAAAHLVGRHDFAGFRAADCERETTEREIKDVSITEGERGLISVDVKGDAFMKNMVRIIAGTLIDVGRKKLSPEIVPEVFKTGDRTLAGQTAPAQGLTLMEVFYPEGWIRRRT